MDMSICSQNVRLCLQEMGVPYNNIEIDIVEKLQHLEPEFARMNPEMLVPVIKHDGEIITDSKKIMYYLCDRFPEKQLIGQDEEEKKQVHEFVEDFYSKFGAIGRFTFGNLMNKSPFYKLYFGQRKGPDTVNKLNKLAKKPEFTEIV